MDLLTACRDANLFQPWFKDGATWQSWFVFLRALFGLGFETDEEVELYTRCTGRLKFTGAPVNEAWITCGRRAGKSFILALVAVYLACFKEWSQYLAPGEVGTVMVIACDKRQARVIMRYIGGFLNECHLLASTVVRQTKADSDGGWGIELNNKVIVEVHTPSFRRVRGYTVLAGLLDEVAFWPSDEAAASPDVEVLEALRPSMATIPGSMLLAASSPYSRRGALWDVYRRHWGKDGPVLVWQAPTAVMNPTVPAEVIDAALERDQLRAVSEWLGEFRSDLESYVSREAVEACIEPGIRERAPVAGVRYTGFVDPSGGRQDAMTLGIAHREGEVGVLDLVRERRPPFSPTDVVGEFAQTLRSYGVRTVRSDRYGGEWVVEAFQAHGVRCEAALKPKSDLFKELLPLINSRRVELLDHGKLVGQLCSLERRVGRGGRDSIDHPPQGHDDVANAVAGVLVSGRAVPGVVVSQRALGL
jgi:hypothetical protein